MIRTLTLPTNSDYNSKMDLRYVDAQNITTPMQVSTLPSWKKMVYSVIAGEALATEYQSV